MSVKLNATRSMQQVQDVVNKGVSLTNNKVTKDIRLDQIDPHPDNQSIYFLSDIEALMERIEESGFFGSIEVYAKPDGRYQISSGHRRYEAMKRLGRKTIPCTIYKMEDDITVKKRLVESNLNVRIASPIELSRAITYYEQLLNESGYTGKINDKLASIFNISRTKIAKLKEIKKFTEELQEYAKSLTFPYEAFFEATHFSKDQQKRLAQLIKSHLSQYPDAELSSVLAKQFIEQVKNETRLEKERKEREKILAQQKQLESSQQSIVSLETSEKVSAFPVSDDTNIEGSSSVTDEKENIQVMPYNEIQKETSLTNVESVSYGQQPVVDINTESDQPKTINIDFEIKLYATKLLKTVNQGNIAISEELKESGISMLRDVLEILENL